MIFTRDRSFSTAGPDGQKNLYIHGQLIGTAKTGKKSSSTSNLHTEIRILPTTLTFELLQFRERLLNSPRKAHDLKRTAQVKERQMPARPASLNLAWIGKHTNSPCSDDIVCHVIVIFLCSMIRRPALRSHDSQDYGQAAAIYHVQGLHSGFGCPWN